MLLSKVSTELSVSDYWQKGTEHKTGGNAVYETDLVGVAVHAIFFSQVVTLDLLVHHEGAGVPQNDLDYCYYSANW